ncbi:MAG: hypothetical protein K1060chlam4_00900 [Candidatus Anoxychlamydiales bacterium]|nr:hypothetical protein [Candidatus Anoxychlamydiales bacterium]
MINDENRLREMLILYNIVKITELKQEQGVLFYTLENIEDIHTIAFPNFVLSFNRTLSIYPYIVQNVEKNYSKVKNVES